MGKGIDGCWRCENFPCDEGCFGSEEWKGLCLGFIQCIKENGLEKFVGLVKSRLEKDYRPYRFMNARGVLRMVRGRGA